MSSGKGGSSTSQSQNVSQSTTVNVTNVIEDKGLEPLEKVKLLADVFVSLDQAQANRQKAAVPQTVLIQPPATPALSFLADPKTIALITGSIILILIVVKKVKG